MNTKTPVFPRYKALTERLLRKLGQLCLHEGVHENIRYAQLLLHQAERLQRVLSEATETETGAVGRGLELLFDRLGSETEKARERLQDYLRKGANRAERRTEEG